MPTDEPRVPQDKLDRRIRATRDTLMQLARGADDTASTQFATAIQELANTLEELEVTAEELRAANDELLDRQLQLEDERRRYRDLFDAAPVAYLTTTPEGTVTAANIAALELLAVGARRLVGKPLALLVAEDDRRAFRTTVNRLATGVPVVAMDCRFVVGEHLMTTALGGVVSVDHAGEVAELRWTLADVSEARRAQAAMQAAYTSERERVEHLTDLDHWKDAFLAAAAHDLRTPLSVIRGAAEMLRNEKMSFSAEQRRDLLDTIHGQTLRMDRLFADLLDLDRFTRGVAILERVATDLTSLMHRVVEETPTERHEVVTDVPEGLAGAVDDVRVGQIVANLLGNAVAHTPEGTSIRVAAQATKGGFRLVVEDDGPGIPSEIAATLFSPFVTMPAHAGARGGTGLGLSLVQMYAQLHGGDVRVEQRDGGGARFVVDLSAD